ncbi:MAG: protein kinase [Prevotella sp.]|nr:protein kinase [Prevotella sp.]
MSDINLSSMLPVGTMLKDTYRIEGFLSSGGFGNTYVATNFTFNEKVAVKEFFLRGVNLRDGESTVSVSNPDNRALFDEQLEKFRKEAQRIRRLRSPHVVRVHDLFNANGTAYYVMDYIDGESLAARLRRTQQPLSESEAMGYFSQVLDALEAIHAAGLCHMDLKPDNVMVDKEDNAVLIDFGASKKIASDQLTSTVPGVSYTNGYAPPEQLESDMDNFGPWTDIYALGATLYKLLTNRKPPMPSAIYSDPTPDKCRSLKFPEGVSEQTRQLVRRLMTVVWHERPQSVADVRRMMGQAEQTEQTEQRTTEYKPQETIFVGDLDLTDDEEVPTLVRNKSQIENNTDNSYSYEEYEDGGSNSRKWIFAIIGVLATAVIVFVFLLLNPNRKESTSSQNASEVSELSTIDKKYAIATAETGTVNIRQSPSKDAPILDKLTYDGSPAEVLSKESNWYRVKLGSVEGYVNGSYVYSGSNDEIEAYKKAVKMPSLQKLIELFYNRDNTAFTNIGFKLIDTKTEYEDDGIDDADGPDMVANTTEKYSLQFVRVKEGSSELVNGTMELEMLTGLQEHLKVKCDSETWNILLRQAKNTYKKGGFKPNDYSCSYNKNDDTNGHIIDDTIISFNAGSNTITIYNF